MSHENTTLYHPVHKQSNMKNTTKLLVYSTLITQIKTAGAPNENMVQNHLNMALLNVFQYLNGRYRHIFIPLKFFICSDFLAESLVIRKLQGSKLTFPKIPARKKAPENSRGPFQGKNPLKIGDYTIFQMFENPRRGRQARNFTTNAPKILDLKSSSVQIFSENCLQVPLKLFCQAHYFM